MGLERLRHRRREHGLTTSLRPPSQPVDGVGMERVTGLWRITGSGRSVYIVHTCSVGVPTWTKVGRRKCDGCPAQIPYFVWAHALLRRLGLLFPQ